MSIVIFMRIKYHFIYQAKCADVSLNHISLAVAQDDSMNRDTVISWAEKRTSNFSASTLSPTFDGFSLLLSLRICVMPSNDLSTRTSYGGWTDVDIDSESGVREGLSFRGSVGIGVR